jgi:acetyl esterase/lipase
MGRFLRAEVGIGLVFVLATAPLRAGSTPAFTHEADVIYGRKAGLALTMDVLTPKKSNGLGLIFIISGGWISSPTSIDPTGYAEFLRRGYTVFTVVHGSQPTFTVPEIVEDVHRAVRFIRYHARDYHIDPERLGISGASSGGHLALMMGVTGRRGDLSSRDPVDHVSSRVAAVACFFPPTDLLNWGEPGNILDVRHLQPPFTAAVDFHEYDTVHAIYRPITDETRMREILRMISPITHISSAAPPTLLVHGDQDELVPLQQSDLMIARLKRAGVPAKLIIKSGGGHGWTTLQQDAEVLADWFDRYLKAESKSDP